MVKEVADARKGNRAQGSQPLSKLRVRRTPASRKQDKINLERLNTAQFDALIGLSVEEENQTDQNRVLKEKTAIEKQKRDCEIKNNAGIPLSKNIYDEHQPSSPVSLPPDKEVSNANELTKTLKLDVNSNFPLKASSPPPDLQSKAHNHPPKPRSPDPEEEESEDEDQPLKPRSSDPELQTEAQDQPFTSRSPACKPQSEVQDQPSSQSESYKVQDTVQKEPLTLSNEGKDILDANNCNPVQPSDEPLSVLSKTNSMLSKETQTEPTLVLCGCQKCKDLFVDVLQLFDKHFKSEGKTGLKVICQQGDLYIWTGDVSTGDVSTGNVSTGNVSTGNVSTANGHSATMVGPSPGKSQNTAVEDEGDCMVYLVKGSSVKIPLIAKSNLSLDVIDGDPQKLVNALLDVYFKPEDLYDMTCAGHGTNTKRLPKNLAHAFKAYVRLKYDKENYEFNNKLFTKFVNNKCYLARKAIWKENPELKKERQLKQAAKREEASQKRGTTEAISQRKAVRVKQASSHKKSKQMSLSSKESVPREQLQRPTTGGKRPKQSIEETYSAYMKAKRIASAQTTPVRKTLFELSSEEPGSLSSMVDKDFRVQEKQHLSHKKGHIQKKHSPHKSKRGSKERQTFTTSPLKSHRMDRCVNQTTTMLKQKKHQSSRHAKDDNHLEPHHKQPQSPCKIMQSTSHDDTLPLQRTPVAELKQSHSSRDKDGRQLQLEESRKKLEFSRKRKRITSPQIIKSSYRRRIESESSSDASVRANSWYTSTPNKNASRNEESSLVHHSPRSEREYHSSDNNSSGSSNDSESDSEIEEPEN